MADFSKLEQEFSSAMTDGDMEKLQQTLIAFDSQCRVLIEQESTPANKKILIETCFELQNKWQAQIIKLKAKVKGELADIKSNGKKIQKYLTSY